MKNGRYSNLIRRLFGLSDPDAVEPDAAAGTLSYSDAKKLSQNENPDVRAQLAARADLFPEVLHYLVSDPSPRVRCEVAGNVATLQRANLLLARDKDEEVRTVLADKICSLVPGLTTEEQVRLNQTTLEALDILSRDHVVHIRRLIAEALKEVTTAPAEIIQRLANDVDIEVSGPILEHSPILTDEDLILIIHSGPIRGALNAISRRVPVQESVSDAIVASHDIEAVATLLDNPSAQIREQTLDFLLDRAVQIPAWHEPLVKRPYLPPVAALRLATFVATDLLDSLRGRTDLSPEAVDAVARIVHKRLSSTRPYVREEMLTTPFEVAESMHKAGSLTETVFLTAVSSGNLEFAVAALTVCSGFPLDTVRAILASKDPMAAVALTWKSGLSASCAEAVQSRLAKIPIDSLLIMERRGIYSFSAGEMSKALEPFGIFG